MAWYNKSRKNGKNHSNLIYNQKCCSVVHRAHGKKLWRMKGNAAEKGVSVWDDAWGERNNIWNYKIWRSLLLPFRIRWTWLQIPTTAMFRKHIIMHSVHGGTKKITHMPFAARNRKKKRFTSREKGFMNQIRLRKNGGRSYRSPWWSAWRYLPICWSKTCWQRSWWASLR